MNHLYVVGIGPGRTEQMTLEARQVLDSCDLIVGYTVYADLLREAFPHKEFLVTPMRQEVDRCRMALKAASGGRQVAVVCSGDAGVYGMAGLILELAVDYPDCQVQVVAGVTAALSGAALLGAPLTHDFAVVSLSDLLTPWEKIEKRLRLGAAADFALHHQCGHERSDVPDSTDGGDHRGAVFCPTISADAQKHPPSCPSLWPLPSHGLCRPCKSWPYRQ